MTKKKDLNPDIMAEISEEEIRMSVIYDTHYYNYRCRDCRYEAKVEDIMVDSTGSRLFITCLRVMHRQVCGKYIDRRGIGNGPLYPKP